MGKRTYYNRFNEEPIELDAQCKLQDKILQQYRDKYDIKELEKQTVISEARVQAALSKYYDDKFETAHTELNELKEKLTNLNNWVNVINSKLNADVATIVNKKKRRRITVRVKI